MDRQRVAVWIAEDRLPADSAVDRLRVEPDSARFELGLGGLVVVYVELEGRRVRAELDPKRIALHQGDRHRPGLELTGGHVTPPLPERQPQGLAVELAGSLVVLGWQGYEVDAVDQLCLSGHTGTMADRYGRPACGAGASMASTLPVRGPLPVASGPFHSWARMNRVLPSRPPSMQAKQPRSTSIVCRTSPPSATRAQHRLGTSAYQTAPSASMQMPSGTPSPRSAQVRRFESAPSAPMSNPVSSLP